MVQASSIFYLLTASFSNFLNDLGHPFESDPATSRHRSKRKWAAVNCFSRHRLALLRSLLQHIAIPAKAVIPLPPSLYFLLYIYMVHRLLDFYLAHFFVTCLSNFLASILFLYTTDLSINSYLLHCNMIENSPSSSENDNIVAIVPSPVIANDRNIPLGRPPELSNPSLNSSQCLQKIQTTMCHERNIPLGRPPELSNPSLNSSQCLQKIQTTMCHEMCA
ncbi:hypothetical protein KSP40_PGU001727 [Platanthera guangdongensis]|uniref:Uncharacterized protein n=1 Tax=Platanthera guangdongensis TaxID=2320717 RepID=A0ABR2LNI8_9ASPA